MDASELLRGQKVLLSVAVPDYWSQVFKSCADAFNVSREQWMLWACISIAVDERNKGELLRAIKDQSPIIKAGA